MKGWMGFASGVVAGALVVGGLAEGGLFDEAGPPPDALAGEWGQDPLWRAVAAAPGAPGPWHRVAEDAQAQGDLVLAELALRRAVALGGDDDAAWAHLGFVLYEAGRDHEATEALRKARALGRIDPLIDFTLVSLTTVLDDSGAFPRFVAREPGEPGPAAPSPSSFEPAGPPDPPIAPAESAAHDREDDLPAVEPEADDAAEGDAEEDAEDNAEESADDPPDDAEVEPGLAPELEDEAEPPVPVGGHGGSDDEGAPDPAASFGGPRVAGAGPCAVELKERGRGGTFVVVTEVGRAELDLVFDTGATLTVLTRDAVERAGGVVDEGTRINARTATGLTSFATAVIDEVTVGGWSLRDVRAAVCDACGAEGVDGLLGLDVQRALHLQLDVASGQVVVGVCE